MVGEPAGIALRLSICSFHLFTFLCISLGMHIHNEERELHDWFGEGYSEYMKNVPGLRVRRRRLKFLNQIAMPFHILHFAVAIPVQYYVVMLPLWIIEKFLLISGISSAIIIGLALIISQFNPLRFLFGMSLRRDTPRS
jgi:hypothetical protein